MDQVLIRGLRCASPGLSEEARWVTAMYGQHSGASLSQDELSLGRWSYGERVVQAEVTACARLGGVENMTYG